MSYFNTLKKKLVAMILFLLILPMVIVGATAKFTAEEQLNEAGKKQMVQSTKMVIGMISLLNEEVEAGHLTLAEAQEKLRIEILGKKDADGNRPINEQYMIGESGYVFATDDSYLGVMMPKNEGNDFTKVKSEDGISIGSALVAAGENNEFLTYKWLNPHSDKIEDKITYSERDPNWGWTITSSAYLSELHSDVYKLATNIGIITAISIIVFSLISYSYSNRLTKPLIVMSKELNRAASGDLSGKEVVVNTKDEVSRLADDFNHMRAEMKKLIQQASDSAEQVAASSEELSASAVETSNATKEISSSMQVVADGSDYSYLSLMETSQTLEQVTDAIQNLAESSGAISETGITVSDEAKEGNELVEKTVQQIHSIYHKVTESEEVLQLLQSSTNEIGEITMAITEIADQTNLLALNAAIEAARAGEHGKGFAVVADEVRKLAEQSQRSTNKIASLIEHIQRNMASSSKAMDTVKDEVQMGLDVVKATEVKFKEIVDGMNHMGIKVSDMAATVEQMSASAEEITATVHNIASHAKDNSSHSQEVAAAAEEQLAAMEEINSSSDSLSKLAMSLQTQIGKFKV